MGRRCSNTFKIIVISTLSLAMVACGSTKKNTITSDDFTINISKIESNDGSYNIDLDFYDKAGKGNYTIYENDKEFKTGRKDEMGKDNKEFIFTGKADGDYLYKVKIEDDNSGIVNKEVKVKVKSDKVDSIKPELTDGNGAKKDETEKSKEAPWNKEAIEYKLKDKVSYKDKTYECIQAHISQEAWTPLDAASLWKLQG